MRRFDLLIRGGSVVTPAEVRHLDIGIVAGQIAALESELNGSAAETLDATGLHIFPGLIDAHVHFNEPGRADWEGFESGSRAFAAVARWTSDCSTRTEIRCHLVRLSTGS